MLNLTGQLLNLDLKELLQVLEVDDDIENVLIILQMHELNTMADLEKLKDELKKIREEKEDEEEDELLAEENQEKNKKLQEIQKKKKSCEKTHDIINSILSKPADFWKDNKPDDFANSLLGALIVPNTKEKRSIMAGGILFSMAKSKNKDIAASNDNSRKGLINTIKMIKQKEKSNQYVL
jgi:hypothetical protein